jgi:pseudouridine kinase
MTDREQQILSLIREDPLISQRKIAEKLGISRSAVAGHIMKLTAKGVIKGRAYVLGDRDATFVAAIGGASMDVHGAPSGELRLHDSNPGSVTTSPGGVARNIAENLARLGVDCRLIAAVGNDDYGETLIRHGQSAGIDMRHVLKLENAKTSTYLSVLDDGGDMLVGVSDMAAVEALDARSLKPHEEMLRNASAIVVDTNLSDATLAYLTSRYADRPIFVDTVSTTKALRIAPYLDAVHSLFPSLIEAETLSGIDGSHEAGLEAIAEWFHERGVRRVFVTLGQRGVFFSADGAQGQRPPFGAGRAINAGGAGDAFVAGITAAWLEALPVEEAIQFAMAAASLTLADTATVSPSMSRAALRRVREEHRAT